MTGPGNQPTNRDPFILPSSSNIPQSSIIESDSALLHNSHASANAVLSQLSLFSSPTLSQGVGLGNQQQTGQLKLMSSALPSTLPSSSSQSNNPKSSQKQLESTHLQQNSELQSRPPCTSATAALSQLTLFLSSTQSQTDGPGNQQPTSRHAPSLPSVLQSPSSLCPRPRSFQPRSVSAVTDSSPLQNSQASKNAALSQLSLFSSCTLSRREGPGNQQPTRQMASTLPQSFSRPQSSQQQLDNELLQNAEVQSHQHTPAKAALSQLSLFTQSQTECPGNQQATSRHAPSLPFILSSSSPPCPRPRSFQPQSISAVAGSTHLRNSQLQSKQNTSANSALSQLPLFSPSTQSQSGGPGHQQPQSLRAIRPRPTSTTQSGVNMSLSTMSPNASAQPSQRRVPPRGRRRVYTYTTNCGRIETKCSFEGTTCLYDNTLPRARESLINISGMFEKYMTCLVKQTTPSVLSSVLDHMVTLSLCTSEDGSLEERKSFLVMQSLLKVQRHVANVAQHTVGRLIKDLSSQTQMSRNFIVCSLCNYAEREKEREYIFLLSKCAEEGCDDCAAAMQSDRGGRSTLATPCTPLQACCRLLELEYQNFTPSFFRQCGEVASLSGFSPIVLSGEPPSCVRTALTPRACRNGHLPSLLSGAAPVFPLHPDRTAIEAVQYCDGDGGYIAMESFVHFERFVNSLSATPTFVRLKDHGLCMIPFRELHHDAIELGHEYTLTVRGKQTNVKWGYDALVSARGVLANAQMMWLVPSTLDRSGNRLLLEVYTQEADELIPKSTRVRLIEAGLSYLVTDSTFQCKDAWKRAIRRGQGIHQYGLAPLDNLHPAHLKQTFNPQVTSVEVKYQFQQTEVTCRVDNNCRANYLNEANVWILKSLLPRAGMGLFLRPTLPGRSPLVIPVRKTICMYSDNASSAISQSLSSDYVMEVDHRGSHLFCNPSVYDGRNIGRFINQGGLLEGIKAMCISCNKKLGGRGVFQGDIHRVMEEKCNTAYSMARERQLYVVALRDLRSISTPTELLSNYFYTYWTRYVQGHWAEMGYQHPVVYGILWCYHSENSVLCGEMDFNVPDTISSELSQAECPYSPSRRRT